MSKTNVGDVERVLRLALAAVIVAAALVVFIASPSVLTAAVAVVCGVTAGLLLRSVRTRYCPIHEKAGVDTTSE